MWKGKKIDRVEFDCDQLRLNGREISSTLSFVSDFSQPELSALAPNQMDFREAGIQLTSNEIGSIVKVKAYLRPIKTVLGKDWEPCPLIVKIFGDFIEFKQRILMADCPNLLPVAIACGDPGHNRCFKVSTPDCELLFSPYKSMYIDIVTLTLKSGINNG